MENRGPVPEVIDCWFDSGAMSYAQYHYPFENQENFDQQFPVDYICRRSIKQEDGSTHFMQSQL